MVLERWLTNEMPHDYKSRFQTLGNVVVPQQAFLAMTVLAQLMRAELR